MPDDNRFPRVRIVNPDGADAVLPSTGNAGNDVVPAGSPFTVPAGTAVNTAVAAFDTNGAGSVDIYITAYGNSPLGVYVQASDGSANWQLVPVIDVKTLAGTGGSRTVLFIQASGLYRVPFVGRRMEVRVLATATTAVTTVAAINKQVAAAVPSTYVDGGNVSLSLQTGPTGALNSVSRLVSSLASTNAFLMKNSACRLYKVTGYNARANGIWLKLYNKNTFPTPGTDTPFFQLYLPPSAAFAHDALGYGYAFTAGLGIALTLGAADNDTAAIASGDIQNLNFWTA